MKLRIEEFLRANDGGEGRKEGMESGARMGRQKEKPQGPRPTLNHALFGLFLAPTPFLPSINSLFGKPDSAMFYIWKTFNKDGVRKPGSEAPG